MVQLIEILKSFNENIEVVISGEPSNETEYLQNVKFISGADENGSAVYKEIPDYSWQQIEDRRSQVEIDIKWKAIRDKRNKLLAETDFYALSDVTMTTEMSNYRQALRDLPSTTSNPDDVVFPTKP